MQGGICVRGEQLSVGWHRWLIRRHSSVGEWGSSPCATSCALGGSDSRVRNSHCGSLYYRAELGLFCLSSIYLALEACPEFSNFVCVDV